MKSDTSPRAGWLQRAGLFFLILALCMFVFVVLSHFRPLLPKPLDLPVWIATAAVLLAAALAARQSGRWRKY